jgi:hypothetical protein
MFPYPFLMFFLLLLVRLLLLHSLCELIVSVLSIGTSLSIHTTKIIPPLYLDLLHALTTIWLKERSSATTPSSQSLVLPLNIRSCHYLSWYLLCLMCLSLINRKIPPSSPSECKDGTSKESSNGFKKLPYVSRHPMVPRSAKAKSPLKAGPQKMKLPFL